jgi:F-type H+-transporting ATPase subunit a
MGSGIHVVLKAEQLGTFLGLPITNSLLMTWFVIAILIIFSLVFRSKLTMIPGKLQAGVEWLFEGVLNYMTETFENEALARKFFPLIMTIFLFLLFANELAFLPGVGSIGLTRGDEFIPFFRAPSADLNLTLALAIISFLTIEITGIFVLGIYKYAGKYVNFKSPVGFIVGLIEILSNLGRLISFSFRLFGNIFAGEVMMDSLLRTCCRCRL